MPRLFLLESGATLGYISLEQLEHLKQALTLEGLLDRDLYINRPTLKLLAADGCDDEVLRLMELALDGRSDVDIAWDEQDDGPAPPRGPFR